MKNATTRITIILLSTMLLGLTGAALAQGPAHEHGRKGQHQPRENFPMPVVDMTMRAVRHLDLSDEQTASIKEIMHALKSEERQLTREMKSGQAQLKELIKAETFDEAAVAELADKEGTLTTERLILASRAMSQVYAQLTDEQRGQLETMAAERAERRAENRRERSDDV